MSETKQNEVFAAQEFEPLLPIEKKLIGWSFGLGIFLLVVLAIANQYLPANL
jgi:hypothetical protein